MTDTEILGKFETTMGNMQKMLQWSHAPFDDERFDQVYCNLVDGELRTVANAGQAVVAYCDYKKPFVTETEVHEDVEDVGMQAILKVPQVRSYLNFVGGDDITLEFHGVPDGEYRADKLVLDGDLRAEIYLPSSDSDYKSKQLKVVEVYNDDNEWVKNNGEPLQTSFKTEASQFQRIIDVVSFDSFALANYPVVVEDGKFLLDAADENDRDSVYGELEAYDIEGPDVSNSYSRGFEELFGNISGELEIGVEQDAPISIVRQSSDEALTLRYSVLPAQ